MSARRRGRECEKDQAQSDGGRTGANPEADQPTPPGGSLHTMKVSVSVAPHYFHSNCSTNIRCP
ncbi:hypothetical protein T06_10352 [Trichinella sp. T6]|nr:hypothetical protein T06_10352 [Trichinella sp. T6]